MSSKDTFKPDTFAASTFACGTFRGLGVTPTVVVPSFQISANGLSTLHITASALSTMNIVPRG